MSFTTLFAYCNKISITHESNAITWDTSTWTQHTHSHSHAHTHTLAQRVQLPFQSESLEEHNKTQRTQNVARIQSKRGKWGFAILLSPFCTPTSSLFTFNFVNFDVFVFFSNTRLAFSQRLQRLQRFDPSQCFVDAQNKYQTENWNWSLPRAEQRPRQSQSRAARQQTWLEFGSNCLCVFVCVYELESTTVAAVSLCLSCSLHLSLSRLFCALMFQPWPRAACLLFSPSFACLLRLFWAQFAFGGISNLSDYRNTKLGLGVRVLAKEGLIGRALSNYYCCCCCCVAHVLIRRRHWAIMFVVVVMHLVQIAVYCWAQCTVRKGRVLWIVLELWLDLNPIGLNGLWFDYRQRYKCTYLYYMHINIILHIYYYII